MPKKPGPEPKPKPKGAMGRVAQALSESKPFNSVEGYKKLPEPVKNALETMEQPELEALGKFHDSLVDGGMFEDVEDEHGPGRVSFF